VAPVAVASVLSACSDSGSGPALPPCNAANAFTISLAVGQYIAVDPGATSGCVAFAGNTGGPIEYLVVPQSATGTPGLKTSFRLAGDTVTAAPLAAQRVGGRAALGAADRFHEFLRLAERDRTWGGAAPAGPPFTLRAEAMPPPVVGDKREFSVCATTTCSRFDKVGAEAVAVGQRLAIFIDTLAPSGGLSSFDLDTLIQVFDTRLYPADTLAFGRESDIDANSVVIVLMTNVVNKLVTSQQCTAEGFVAGFFFGADIDPRFANDNRVNHGEVFYSIVADPAGTLSCQHSRDQVKRLVPVTFVHEFQHMISYNQHVLVRGGDSEELWLNEALSHFAEEVGGRTYLPGDVPSFSRFLLGNLYNAYSYLDVTEEHYLLAAEGIGSLAERGAAWLFMRYLVDQFAADTTLAARSAFTRSLVATTQVGSANVVGRTGQPFAQTVTRWALANWVSDLPGFTAPAELRYRSWQFRRTFDTLHVQAPGTFVKPYPLVPTVSAGDAVVLGDTLRAGSGVFHRVLHPGGAQGFTLQFSTATGGPLPGTTTPRLNVIRIQ
jgi:hypothetical protein